MAALGPEICPVVYGVDRFGYMMEWVARRDLGSADLATVVDLLQEHVWSRRITRDQFTEPLWIGEMQAWLGEVVPEYISTHDSRNRMIHGDPTLANLMWRGQQPVLIDPLRPSGKIPYHLGVDISCLLQSMCGWEQMLCGEGPEEGWALPETVFYNCSPGAAVWWLRVKARRIRPYALDKPGILGWCDRVEGGCLDLLERF